MLNWTKIRLWCNTFNRRQLPTVVNNTALEIITIVSWWLLGVFAVMCSVDNQSISISGHFGIVLTIALWRLARISIVLNAGFAFIWVASFLFSIEVATSLRDFLVEQSTNLTTHITLVVFGLWWFWQHLITKVLVWVIGIHIYAVGYVITVNR